MDNIACIHAIGNNIYTKASFSAGFTSDLTSNLVLAALFLLATTCVVSFLTNGVATCVQTCHVLLKAPAREGAALPSAQLIQPLNLSGYGFHHHLCNVQ